MEEIGRGWGFHLIPVPFPNKKQGKKISPVPMGIFAIPNCFSFGMFNYGVLKLNLIGDKKN